VTLAMRLDESLRAGVPPGDMGTATVVFADGMVEVMRTCGTSGAEVSIVFPDPRVATD